MPKINFVGPSYVYNSLTFDAQRCVNFYPVKSETGTSRDTWALNPTAGLVAFTTFAGAGIRGSWEVLGRCFFVASGTLYEAFANGSSTARGSLLTFSGTVSMTDNGGQLCIVDGTDTGGWILDLSTNVFTQITADYFLGAVTVVFLGGYFVFNKPNSSVYYISAIYDGLNGDPTDFAVAEGSPDNLVCLVVLHNEVYLIGDNTIEIIYNSGNADFPLSPISGAFIEYGTASAFAATATADAIIWVKQDIDGNAMIFKTNSYNPTRISTNPIEKILSKYDLTNAVAYTYQENGHTFYCLNAPQVPTTLIYDIENNLWSEKAYFDPAQGVYSRHRGNNHVFCFGKHLIGDYENGIVYQQSLELSDDNGVDIRRMRTLPWIIDDLEYIYFKSLQIDMQVGVGLVSGAIEDTNPQIYLEWANDGHSFTNGVVGSVGKIGEYLIRVIWRRLGRGRARVYRLTTSTKAKIFLIAAHSDADRGNS
jgi:hypothetical protein